jgi:G3E family GTPase
MLSPLAMARQECSNPAMSAPDDALPIALLTGFLGSGKTTFLRRALAASAFSDTAVLVNEIGEIALDHYLVETAEGPILELPGGCLCCATREDLAQTLRDLLARRDQASVAPFRRIAIETTGLADPAPVLFTLGADPMLDARLRLARVVTTIDAVSGDATLERFPEAARQAAVADRLILTKADLGEPSEALLARLGALNPSADRFHAQAAEDAGEILFGGAAMSRPVPNQAMANHTHDIAAHAVVLTRPVTRLAFAKALGALARDRGHDLLRLKGIVAFSDRPQAPAFIQGAQHALYPPTWLEGWPDSDRRSRLVFIVASIPLDDILGRFAFAGAEALTQTNAH